MRLAGSDMVVSDVHLLKAEFQIFRGLVELPNVTDVREIQFSKVLNPIDVRPSGKDNIVSATHPEKA